MNISLNIRKVSNDDRQSLASLIHFERYVHRHMDWKSPLEWIGCSPYLIAENEGKIIGALACPIDPPGVAWIRFLVISASISMKTAWNALWVAVLDDLSKKCIFPYITAIPINAWFRDLLIGEEFMITDKVIILLWSSNQIPLKSEKATITIRSMNMDDLCEVVRIDNKAFSIIWRNSLNGITMGFQQSTIATVAYEKDKIVGYQISTATSNGGHLARLAVLPSHQGRGIGFALVSDMLTRFRARGIRNITVNTQVSNLSSLAIYKKAGFQHTGEEYPVYQYTGDH